MYGDEGVPTTSVASLFSITMIATWDDGEVGSAAAGGAASGLPVEEPPHDATASVAAPTTTVMSRRGRRVGTRP